MANVKIDITVDTEKLKNAKPGEITDRTIVVMTDNQPDSYYDNPTSSNFKDKLHTLVDKGDNLEWNIESLNKKADVSFVDYKGDDITKLYDKKPEKEKGANKFKAKIRTDLTEKIIAWYTFDILFEGKTYYWDPYVEPRKT